MSKKQTRLFKRNSTYYIRCCVPKIMVFLVKKKEIRYTLHTKDYKEASFRARIVSVKLDLVFKKLERKMILDIDAKSKSLKDAQLIFEPEDYEKCLIFELQSIQRFIEDNFESVKNGDIQPEDVLWGNEAEIKHYEDLTGLNPLKDDNATAEFLTMEMRRLMNDYLRHLADKSPEKNVREYLKSMGDADVLTFIREKKISVDDLHIKALLDNTRVVEEYIKKSFEAIRNNENYEPNHPKMKRWLHFIEEAEQKRLNGPNLLTDWRNVLPMFLDHKKYDRLVQENTLISTANKLEVIFEGVIKKRHLQEITYQDCLDLSVRLSSLPKRFGINKKSKEEPIKMRTRLSYLTVFREFMRWCYTSHIISNDLSNDIVIPSKKAIQKSDIVVREAFTKQDLLKIFNYENMYHKMDRKKVWRYFVCLIGLTSAARLDEIAQLNICDIQKENGVWYYNITDEGELQHLKNPQSKRRTPIHSIVIDMGLLDYIKVLKQEKQTRLFPTLKYRKRRGFGGSASQHFGRHLNYLGITRKEKVFHSFRYFLKQEMRDVGISQEFQNAIAGWEQQGTGAAIYGRQHKVAVLSKELEKVSFSFLKKTLKELKANRPIFMRWEDLKK